jgi:photosystem II stability/assembly factor-like uncharacterized protein
MKNTLYITMIILCVNTASAQWQHVIPSFASYYAVASNNTSVFATYNQFYMDYGYMGHLYLSTDNGNSWNDMDSGITNPCVYSLIFKSQNIFAGTSSGIFISTNNGGIWTPVNNGLTSTYVVSFGVKGNVIFAGTMGGGIFSSTNDGALWTQINNGLTDLQINTIAVSDSNIFVGTDNGIFLSSNNGGLWTNKGLANLRVNAIAIKDTNIFAGTNNGLYLSTNNGITWSAVNNSLPTTEILKLATIGTHIFAFPTCSGMYFSDNNGTNWMSSGLTSQCVLSVALNDSFIYAGTYNGGVWRRSLFDLTNLENNFINENNIIFPNPNNGIFTLTPIGNLKQIEIFNLIGEVIYRSNNFYYQKTIEINLSNTPKGIYFIKTDNGENINIEKIVIN